jgi:hypothetical protein
MPQKGYYFPESLIESTYPSFKQRTRTLFNSMTSNPLDEGERFRRYKVDGVLNCS